MPGKSCTIRSPRLCLDEAEAQLRVFRSPQATDAERLERCLWAAFLAANQARTDPACFRAWRILQRSAQGFLRAWHRTQRGTLDARVFFVGGERFELREAPAAQAADGRHGLRWEFREQICGSRRTVEVSLKQRHVSDEPRPGQPVRAPAGLPARLSLA